jgi:hypothetical protein
MYTCINKTDNVASLATISNLCVLENDTAVGSGAMAMIAASDFALDATYEHQAITVPDFDMSEEVNDYMAEDGVQEECRPGDVPNWYDDNDNDYIPSDVDDNN